MGCFDRTLQTFDLGPLLVHTFDQVVTSVRASRLSSCSLSYLPAPSRSAAACSRVSAVEVVEVVALTAVGEYFGNLVASNWAVTLAVPGGKLLDRGIVVRFEANHPDGGWRQGRQCGDGRCHHEVGGARWTQPSVTAGGRFTDLVSTLLPLLLDGNDRPRNPDPVSHRHRSGGPRADHNASLRRFATWIGKGDSPVAQGAMSGHHPLREPQSPRYL